MTAKQRSKKSGAILYPAVIAGVALFLLAYVVLRAVRVNLTYDEALTYGNYLTGDLLHVFNFSSTNNHLLNSFLARFFYILGGNIEWVLRLPNLLGYGLYLAFSFLILNKLPNKVLAVGGFLLLNLNPYVLDFFSLCRGYGLSLGFLMAAFFFYISFLEKMLQQKEVRYRDLSWSFGMSACSVLANYVLLNVYLSLAVLTIVLFAIQNRRQDAATGMPPKVRKTTRTSQLFRSLFILFALLFNLFLIAQDIMQSEKFGEPLTVRFSGPGFKNEDPQGCSVWGVRLSGGDLPFGYERGLWTFGRASYLSAIKLQIPRAVLAGVEAVEIRIGAARFQAASQEILKWKNDQTQEYAFYYSSEAVSLKRPRFLHLNSVINWKGNRPFFLAVLGRLAMVIGVTAAILLVMVLAGLFLKRWKILTKGQARWLASALLMMAAFTAYPFYMFKKSGAFAYWGSDGGFFQDTVLTLVQSSFYGKAYFPDQALWILGLIHLSFLAGLVLAVVHYRKKSLPKIGTMLLFISVLSLSGLSTVAQKILVGTPYLYERTALFLIPMAMLFLIFLFQSLGQSRPGTKLPVACLSILLTLLTVFHFSQTANTRWTLDWKFDADTKNALEYISRIRAGTAGSSNIRLTVHWLLMPVVQYYREQESRAWLELSLVDNPDLYANFDFCYLRPESVPQPSFLISRRISVSKKYAISGNLLLRKEKR